MTNQKQAKSSGGMPYMLTATVLTLASIPCAAFGVYVWGGEGLGCLPCMGAVAVMLLGLATGKVKFLG